MSRLLARRAGLEIARILWTRHTGIMSGFEVIWDEIASGNHTYGKSPWTRFIQAQPKDSDYWYKRVRTIAFNEISNRESYSPKREKQESKS